MYAYGLDHVELGEHFFCVKMTPLGVLDLLHVGSSLGGSGLEPRTISGHGCEERGSSKVIWLSFFTLEIETVLLILGVEVC